MNRSYAIIPAAGLSLRMGKPKLLMPWGDSTLIERVISAMRDGGVSHVVVTVRPADKELAALCKRSGSEVVVPDADPPEMKVSVQLGLAYVDQQYSPKSSHVWLLVPADMPRLSARVVSQILRGHDPRAASILVPTIHGRRGHPVLFPWPLADEARKLAEGEGVNALLGRHPVRMLPCDDPAVLDDLDTPEDYARLQP